jgi:hypothetical protein
MLKHCIYVNSQLYNVTFYYNVYTDITIIHVVYKVLPYISRASPYLLPYLIFFIK